MSKKSQKPIGNVGPDVGKRIKELRKAQGFSRVETARAACISLRMLEDFEDGRLTNPGLARTLAIANVLGADISEIAGEAQRNLHEVMYRTHDQTQPQSKGD